MTRFSIYISSLDSSPLVEAVMSAYDDYSSLRRPSLAEMYKFIMKAAKEEHLMRGDWESNRDEISCEADQFIKDSIRDDDAVTDGKGIVVNYAPPKGGELVVATV